MQDFVRICIADTTDQTRIGKSPLEGAVFRRQCRAKRVEIAREGIDSSRIHRSQAFFATDDV
jgi:hypothetical protein